MRKDFTGPRMALALMIGLFSSYSEATTEDRINTAIPLPKSVQLAKTALLDRAVGSERAQVEAAFEAKLRARAIECSQGYAPTLFTSIETIREHLANSRACFDRHDDSLARWIGLRRVGHLLRMPPLRPIPTTPAQSILNSEGIQEIQFAPEAGVVLFHNRNTIEMVDLSDGSRIARIALERPDSRAADLSLSSNARVLAALWWSEAVLLDAETGESLVRLRVRRYPGFFWLGKSHAFYAELPGSEPTLTIDFDTGEERPNSFEPAGVQNIRAIPGTADQFMLFSNFDLSRLQVSSSAAAQPAIVTDRKEYRSGDPRNYSEFTSDGHWYISTRHNLALTSTATLETTTITMAPLDLRKAMPLPDPDLLLLEGIISGGGPAIEYPLYVYSISRKTLARVETRGASSPRFIYIPSLKRLGSIEQGRLTLVDTPATEPPVPLEQVQASVIEQINQYRAHFGEQATSRPPNLPAIRQAYARGVSPVQHDAIKDTQLEIGESVSSVQRALHTSQAPVPAEGSDVPGTSELYLRDRGIRVFFNSANQAQQYRFEAPFSGDIYGAKIGAWMGEVRSKLGYAMRAAPTLSPTLGDIDVYHIDLGVTLRCDFDKNSKVQAIRLLTGSVAFSESKVTAH